QKFINPFSRLIFVGLWSGFETYYHALRKMIVDLRIQEVVFTGHITFDELLAFYRLADVLVTISEHERFFWPLLEAFYRNLPVLAWDACAIPYTAGEGAVLVQGEKNYAQIGEMMHRICSDAAFRSGIVAAQQRQLQKHQSFPFEQTLLDALAALSKTKPI